MVIFQLFYAAIVIWLKAEAEHLSAALAYYIPFALTPLLLISISIVGLVSGTGRVAELLYSWGAAIDPGLAELFSTAVQNFEVLTEQFAVPLLAVVFFSGMIFVTMNFLAFSLHKVSGQVITGWWHRLRVLGRCLLFVVVIQAYVLFVIVLEELLQIAADFFGSTTVLYLKSPALLVSTGLLCLIGYSVLITKAASMPARMYASLVVTGLFMVAGFVVRLHLATAPIPDLFGATGMIFVLLLWLYVIATIILFGAAFARAYDERLLSTKYKSISPRNF